MKNPIDIKSEIKYNKLTAIGIALGVEKRRTAILYAMEFGDTPKNLIESAFSAYKYNP